MGDEWGDGSQLINEVQALRKRVTELAKQLRERELAYERLERRVDDRTRELERTSEELRVSEDNYREIFDASTHMIMLQDIETGAILDMNAEMTRESGYTLEELSGSGVQSFSPKGPGFEPERAIGYIQKAAMGEPQTFEWGFVDKEGAFHPTEVNIKRVAIGGVPRLLATARDITMRKQAEAERDQLQKQVQQAQKLESLGVLAGGIAHDFNNLLAGVLGNAGLAMMKLPPESPGWEYIKNVETTAQRAAELTNQMLAYSGKGGFIVQPLVLSQAVGEMGHLLETVVSKKVKLDYRFAPDLPDIDADVAQIRQVLMNLITNASDAMGDDGGVITVTTGLLEADTSYLATTFVDWNLPPGPYVFVDVADTGSGMDEETLKRIFDPFFTTKFTGRGLGLAATLGIIRGHRGAIKVESEVGGGTSVRVLFPAVSNPGAVRVAGSVSAEDWRGEGLVLVVDDEGFVRDMAVGIIEAVGFAAITAQDGLEAVGIFRERGEEIRVVLLDMTMPRMSGEETLIELRRIKEDVPVLLSSGYSEQEAQTRFAGRGLSGFIQKPYTPQKLSGVLRGILDT